MSDVEPASFAEARRTGERLRWTFTVSWGWTLRARAWQTIHTLAAAHHVELELQEHRGFFSSSFAGTVRGWCLDVRTFRADIQRMNEGNALFRGQGLWWQ